LLEIMGEVAAVLDRPDDLIAELVRSAQRFEVSLFLGGDLSLAVELPGRGVDGRECVGALVDISSDHDHPARPFS
jgi:hypothetical protein